MIGQTFETLYVGIDVDGPFCRLFAVDINRKAILRRSIAREYIWMSLPTATKIVVGIEYRSCVHELAHKLVKAGLEVRLIRFRDIPRLKGIPPSADYGRAEALCEAVRVGATRYVPILAPSEQDRAASLRIKALLKRQRATVLSAARKIVESVDVEQGSDSRNDQDIAHRLGSMAEAGSRRQASAALLDVLSVLERNIAAFDDIEPRFEVISDDAFSSLEDKATSTGAGSCFRGSTRPFTESCAFTADRGSNAQA